MTDAPDRRAALLAAKLGALVRDRWGEVADGSRPGTFPGGSSLIDADSGRAWILLDDEADAARRLGATLAVADRAGVTELHLLVDDPIAAGILARRAALFAHPPAVWSVAGRNLNPAPPAAAATDPAPAPEAELYRPVLAAGLEPVVEGGELLGESWASRWRVWWSPTTARPTWRWVSGRFDREVGAMMFADLGDSDALARAVDVRRRAPARGSAPPAQPAGARALARGPCSWPARLVGSGRAALRRLVACPRRNLGRRAWPPRWAPTSRVGPWWWSPAPPGVDLDLVPSAADDRLTHAPDARLVLAVPGRRRPGRHHRAAGPAAPPGRGRRRAPTTGATVPVGDS
jgi:hypothetical protein